MTVSIGHLGPTGTYAEMAALTFQTWLLEHRAQASNLVAYPTIAQTLQAVAQNQVDLAIVPVENSVEGGVTMTMDTLWQLDQLHIQHALTIPIHHALISCASQISDICTVYSHPQALAQCQQWLGTHLPQAQAQPTNSTTEALGNLSQDRTIGAIASQRAAELYQLPILACPINDHPDNQTRFLVLSREESPGGAYTSLAFSIAANRPGSLLKMLQIFADREINLSRIESRPSKRSMGDYLFFLDLEADARAAITQAALRELIAQAETVKLFGSYDLKNYAEIAE
ncbi:prephenate dehydratase [Alkalinema sp. FACHB-956]|uniref:prephenate dehydratase n=1 Tax=Alkalinema sp. FACHB-956 TaxID=2692768 RepID=UPI001685B92B|nr:prephenate dehydratase [Alkalinema sp. FACHB-956]MBD2328987.1 prephenate dehydratase [Alkalinema sp. FACHB-956]